MSEDGKQGLASLIHVLGGLPRRGRAYLIYGRCGLGKSTLAMGMLCELDRGGIRGHYVSTEQSLTDAERQFSWASRARLLARSTSTAMWEISASIDRRKAAVHVIDSIFDIDATSAPAAARALSCLAVERDVVIFATGYTNAAGGLAGGDRLRKHFADVLHLRARGDADPHRILETEATPRRQALFKMHEGRILDCGPLPNEEA